MLRVAVLAILGLAACVSAVTYPNLQPGAQIKLSASSLQYSGQQIQVRFDPATMLLLVNPLGHRCTQLGVGSADSAVFIVDAIATACVGFVERNLQPDSR